MDCAENHSRSARSNLLPLSANSGSSIALHKLKRSLQQIPICTSSSADVDDKALVQSHITRVDLGPDRLVIEFAQAATLLLAAGAASAQDLKKDEAPARAPAAQHNAPAEKVAPAMKPGAQNAKKGKRRRRLVRRQKATGLKHPIRAPWALP